MSRMKNAIRTVIIAVALMAAMLFATIMMLMPALPASAFEDHDARVVDMAGLLDEDELQELTSLADEVSERQEFDVVAVTTNGLDGEDITDYADDYFDYHNYGYGDDYDGCILVIDMDSRDYWISTCGYGTTALTDAGINYVISDMQMDMSGGYYKDAIETYINDVDEYVTDAKNGNIYDYDDGQGGSYDYQSYKEPFNVVSHLIMALVVGFVISFIVNSVMKSKLKSVAAVNTATNYVKRDSLNLTKEKDIYLYSTVIRTEIPRDNDGSSHHGGSTVHTSSSGRSHGGGGGHF